MNDEQISQVRGKQISFVFQTFNLIPQLTVLQNVQVPRFYLGLPRQRGYQMAIEAIGRVGLANRADHRPSQLSGGQQQRAAIAQALVNEPSLLLADEPTGNLDSVTGLSILRLFENLHQQGLTIMIVTHDRGIASRTQRVVWLKDGQIAREEQGEARVV